MLREDAALGGLTDRPRPILVEVTDVHGLDKPIPGFEASRAGPVDVRFSSVVVHAEGRVRLAPQNAPKSTLSSTTIRAELVLGPLAVH